MKVRKIGLAKQIFWTMLVVVGIGICALAGAIYGRAQKSMMSQIRENVENLAKCAAASVDAEVLMGIQEGDEGSEAYEQVLNELTLFLDSSNLQYIYTLRKNADGGIEFLVDADPEAPAAIGEEYENLPNIEKAFAGETSADTEPSSDEWGTYISAYSPIYYQDKVVAVVGADVSYTWVQEQIQSIFLIAVNAGIGILVFLLVALWFIQSKLKHGFTTLHDKVCELADGSGDINKEVELLSGDEFEVIADDINNFIREVRTLVMQVAESTGDNSLKISYINDSILEVSANMEECSATSESVCVNLTDTATRVQDLAGEVKKVERFVNDAGKKAMESTKLAEDRQREAIETIEKMKVSLMAAEAETKNVELVAEIAEQVSRFALQTRILSLNAQVEAGRAGEAGKGFAVVASSVGELSAEIANATNEINEVNQKVIHAVRNLNEQVEQMNEYMSNAVRNDYNTFADMGKYFTKYTESVQASMEQLTANSAQIAGAITGVNYNVQDISKAVYDTATQVEKLSGNSGDIAKNMNDLTQLPLLRRK